jgi:predicted transcriptional regulator
MPMRCDLGCPPPCRLLARPAGARHIVSVSTTAAKPNFVRRAVGLNETELGVLSAVVEHYRLLVARGYGMTLSHDRLAYRLNVDRSHVKWAINHLVELAGNVYSRKWDAV